MQLSVVYFVRLCALFTRFAIAYVAAGVRNARSQDVTVTIEIVLNGTRIVNSGARIVNGTYVFPREFPFLVAILDITNPSHWYPKIVFPWEKPVTIEARPYCSGTLVSLQHVLTACHCTLDLVYHGRANALKLRKPRSIMIIAGRSDIDPIAKWKKPPLIYNNPKTLHYHPKCFVGFAKTIWDVGIMELEEAYPLVETSIVPLPLFDFGRIYTLYVGVHLTSREWFEQQGLKEVECVTTGFGDKWNQDAFLAYKAKVKLLSIGNCTDKLRLATEHLIDGAVEFENRSQLCTLSAGTPCDGDSGGPLLCDVPDVELRPRYKRVQVGVISHGKVCGNMTVPVLYTRIDEMTDWINSIISPSHRAQSSATRCEHLQFIVIFLLIECVLAQ